MAYISQKTRAAQLIIGGQDLTSSLIQFQVSDSSAYKAGLITTTGTIVLGQRPGRTDIEDYDRNVYKRGTLVTLDITEPGGSAYRHPRGYLYVFSSSYNVEKEQLTLDVGCRIALGYLTDNVDSILPLVPIPLDPAQKKIENCSASFASAGMVLYQDNQGDLVSRKFFGTDSAAGIEDGEWVSVLGVTALSVSPLSTSGAIPDTLKLSYQVPAGVLAGDEKGKVDTVTEISNYFINYPATVWKRNPPPDSGIPDSDPNPPSPPSPPSNCGQLPTPPANPGAGGSTNTTLCADSWTTDRVATYLPATRTTISETTYGGPAGQVSYVEQTVEAPKIEANSSFYADYYAFCKSSFGYGCNPSGNCPFYGMDTMILSKVETFYTYGEANELIRTIQDTYEARLSAYTAVDYRAGIKDGVATTFSTAPDEDTGLYRSSRVITENSVSDNFNIQKTTTFSSMTSRGVGISSGSSLDALDGIKTTIRRESVTSTTLDVRPDSVNSPITSTEEYEKTILLTPDGYITPPNESADYVFEDSIPSPLLSEDENEVKGWVDDYCEYAKRFIKGDLYGLQIAESMRSEIVTNWYPGMPFRYADTANDKIMAMRMDACTWGVTSVESALVTNGIWLGYDSGTLDVGSNLTGNSRPDMSGDNPQPPPSLSNSLPIIIDSSVGENLEFIVEVNLYSDFSVFNYFDDGRYEPNPTDLTGLVETTTVPYVTGFVVATGGLLESEGNGSIPIELNGSLITEDAFLVISDVFDPDAVPVAPESPGISEGSVELLMHFDGDLSDDSGNTRAFSTENGATTSSAQAKFGSESLQVSVNGSISTSADAGFDLEDEDFTVELFFHPTQDPDDALPLSLFETLISCSGQGADFADEISWQLRLERKGAVSGYPATTGIRLEWYSEGGNELRSFQAITTVSSELIQTDQWNHIVVQRSYDDAWLAMWLNGVRIYNAPNNFLSAEAIRKVSDKTNPIFRIGARADADTGGFPGFEGFIDDIRIVKGGLRYEMGTEVITVPTSPLTTGL